MRAHRIEGLRLIGELLQHHGGIAMRTGKDHDNRSADDIGGEKFVRLAGKIMQ